MKTIRLLALAISALALNSAPAQAGGELSANLGQFNALRDGEQALQYGLEYRLSEFSYGVRPVIGAFGTEDGSAYAYAGVNWDVELLPKQVYIIPNFAIGAYREGAGKKLGGALEFRSGIELAYQFRNQHRVGVALNHLSNAGLYDRNPGVESVIATYSLPLSF